MSETGYLIEVIVILLAAVISVLLFQRLKLGSVLGYLVAGTVIGPTADPLDGRGARGVGTRAQHARGRNGTSNNLNRRAGAGRPHDPPRRWHV